MAEIEELEEIAKLSLPVSSKRDHIQGKSSAPVTLVDMVTTSVHTVAKHI